LGDHVRLDWLDYAEYLIDVIIRGGIESRSWTDFVPVNSEVLRKTIPNRVVRPLKEELLNAGILETDGQYIPGVKSYGYRLGAAYREKPIARKSQAKPRKRRLTDPVHRWLREQFQNLTIDVRAADRLLADHKARDLVRIPAEQIAAQSVEFAVCKYGRVHTSLTRMPKVLRPALSFEGESLLNLDIPNSQPLMLGIIARDPDSFRKIRFRSKYLPLLSQSLSPIPPIQSLSIMKCIESKGDGFGSQTTGVFAKTVAEFISLCERGELYGFLAGSVPKAKLKKAFFRMLYAANTLRLGPDEDSDIYSLARELKTAFKQLFPALAELVYTFKVNDHAYLPRLMQLVESSFMVDRVCRRLMADKVPVFTIHDSLLTTRQHVETAKAVMVEEFGNIGLHPTLRYLAA
jgi:hypothetical protein